MSIKLIITLLLLSFLFFLIILWFRQAFNERDEKSVFSNIYKFIEYHQRNLIKAYIRTGDKVSLKKFRVQLNEPITKDYFKMATNLDDIAFSYNELGMYLESRNAYVEALKLRKWIHPESHQDIDNNLNNLMASHSYLKDHKAARIIFEYKMQQRNYNKYLQSSLI